MKFTILFLIICDIISVYLFDSFVSYFIEMKCELIAPLIFAILFGIIILFSIPYTIRLIILYYKNRTEV
jgi:hypothetical protein